MEDVRAISDRVRDIAYGVHVYLGHGHLEKVYENALTHRLRKAGLRAVQQHPVGVFDEDGFPIGRFVADIVVNDLILIEIKAAQWLAREHEAQLLGYLKATRLRHGLLINFGRFKFEIRKYIR